MGEKIKSEISIFLLSIFWLIERENYFQCNLEEKRKYVEHTFNTEKKIN